MENAITIQTKRDSLWYFNPNEGYYYRQDKLDGDVRRLVCIDKYCIARAKVPENLNGAVQMTEGVQHNHPPDPMLHLVETFHRRLLERAANEDGSLNRIYEDEATRYTIDLLGKLPFVKVDRGMRQRRSKNRPAVPNSLLQLSQIIDQRAELRTTYNNTPFYVAGNEHNVLYVSPATCELLENPNTIISIDGTFKCVPKTPRSYQLFTIGGLIGRRFCLIAYCLMANKTTESYSWIFNRIRGWFPNWDPHHFVADYETGVAAAINEVFDNAVLQGCWFHYAQGIERKMRKLGLQPAVVENEEIRSVVKQIQALPLLPADKIEEGLQEILWYTEIHLINTPAITELIDYVWRYWIEKIGVDRVSVYQRENRTNNAHEGFHSHAMLHMVSTRNGAHPNIWIFLEGLKKKEHSHAGLLRAAQNGLEISFRQSATWMRHHLRIALASQRLENEEIDTSDFLRWMAHHADFDLMEQLMQEQLQMELEEDNFD